MHSERLAIVIFPIETVFTNASLTNHNRKMKGISFVKIGVAFII